MFTCKTMATLFSGDIHAFRAGTDQIASVLDEHFRESGWACEYRKWNYAGCLINLGHVAIVIDV